MTLQITSAASTSAAKTVAFQAKAHAAAQDFEAMFLNTMMQPMFATANDGGPFSGGPAAAVWRSMLTDQYARTFAKSGGIGIANHVYNALLAAQGHKA